MALLTPGQVSLMLNISQRTLHRLAEKGEFKRTKIGTSHPRYDHRQFLDFVSKIEMLRVLRATGAHQVMIDLLKEETEACDTP